MTLNLSKKNLGLSWTVLRLHFEAVMLEPNFYRMRLERASFLNIYYIVEVQVLNVLCGYDRNPLLLPLPMALLNPLLNWSPRNAYSTGLVALFPYISNWK